ITAPWNSSYWISMINSMAEEFRKNHDGEPIGLHAYRTGDLSVAEEIRYAVDQLAIATATEDEMFLDELYYHEWNQDSDDDIEL
ncbi:MAG: hypothetical protein DRP09_12085, partial [Candidatus Thorarchaeota archaeon]